VAAVTEEKQSVQEMLQRGLALHKAGAMAEAGALYRSALMADPANVDALHLLGLTYKAAGKLDEAQSAIGAAVALKPDFADAHYNLGNTLASLGRTGEAVASFRRALALNPSLALAAYNLGNTLRDAGDLDGAAEAFRAAISAKPDYVEACHNLANVLKSLNRLDEAIVHYRRAVQLNPGLAEAHYNLGLALMLTGGLKEGFDQYEWRWAVDGFPTPKRQFTQPAWDGTPIGNRVLLIHAEQAFGDSIQFCRYLPLIASHAGRVIFECRRPLLGLMAGLAGVSQLVEAGTTPPAFDCHAPLLSLPRILRTGMDSIPANVPYLSADTAKVARWRKLRDERFTVGLIWAGNRKPDPNRTVGLAAMSRLIDIPGVRFVALQRDLEPGDRDQVAKLGNRLDHWGAAFGDFADVAAAMEAIDLVITIDTGPAHLAGALGRPTWICLPFSPDWRWLMGRDDSPWYPTARLFRQTRRGDWADVIGLVAGDLRQMASAKNA